jgi:two-component system cell cycle sensor histidine kinase/response regulator CckA
MKDKRKAKPTAAVEQQLRAELSELRQKVAALEASTAEHARAEARNRALYEFSPDGIVTVGLDGRIVECNPAYAEMLGYGHKELEGLTCKDTMPPRWHDFCDKIHREVMERGYSYEFEKECIKKDGTVFPVSMRAWRIDDKSGEPIGIWSIVRDITERKEKEEELRRYSERLEELVEDKTRTLRESGESFRALAESANDGILIGITAEGTHVYANKRAAEMTGYSTDELLKTSIKDLTHPDEFTKIISRYRKRLAGEDVPRQYETIFTRKDGKDVPVELTAARTTWHGQPAVMIITRDITERKLAEKALRESEREKAVILGNMREHVIYQDLDMRILWANRAAGESVGLPSEQLVGRHCYEIWNQRGEPCVGCPVLQARESGQPQEAEMTTPDGRMWLVRGYLIQDTDGKTTGAVEVTLDITERKRAEEALRESEERYCAIFEQAADSIVLIDAETGALVEFNDRAQENLDYTREEFEKLKVSDFEITESTEQVAKHLETIIKEGADTFETKQRTKSGEVRDILVSARAISVRGRDLIQGIWRDITEQKRAEEALRESEERFRTIFESAPIGFCIMDATGRPLRVNHAFKEIFKLTEDELRNVNFIDYTHPDDVEDSQTMFRSLLEGENDYLQTERRYYTGDGHLVWGQVAASVVRDGDGEFQYLIAMVEDITERKHLEEQMRLQERLAAVGQLAGGIAHDFNNFLTTIMLYAQILLRKPSLPPELAPVAETILEESRRAAQLVRRLLDFSRRSLIETRPVDLASFLEETADILRRTLPENIQLLMDIGSQEYIVNADPTRIQQVMMNLALNARDAMPDGGKLRIGLSHTEIKEGDEPPVAEMASGEWVCLTISDTGTGMTEEVQSHLFEPFFTTKGPKGTGLGLAQVYGVVKRHDGYIGVETQVGQGTTFRVYLRPHEATELTESQKAPSAPPQGHGEIILWVEDEDRVREVGREILESLGYRVLTAANGQEAMQVYRSAERVDLVLTDLVMPEMGGKELAHELKKTVPRVKVLAITGYTLIESVEELKQAGILDIVHKPFEVKTLAEVIRQTLDAD